ncbi:sugar porter family MFS transporter [Pantoea sp. EABMAA-21]|jgi:MFS transporter, SP family, xylose:H+ symportor|uniref:sugar porter family MFS transporter n=1 Tax=unclassified Pantoea TaxID=2630326 RepID=UPI000BD68B19|nr:MULTISPECIES: sugar porter family MFS transporter [unclassified Pantoea]MDI9278275.1 sugar porter family MFS transporter [Pantoea sp. EABMAA-21]MXP53248.1 sugar porter family MFS transporter [Pantoea sp. Seng]MXP60683.1 sugar porter family MFS transporter [Pantoea sp. Taur]SNY69187.1 MFS transporter, SP family, xylose:H+ symportor [Pantoea sp. GL120224-02]
MDTRQKRYNMKYVILCCTVAAFGGLLMGYDSSIISGAIEPLSEYFQLTPAETGWAVSNILLGSLVGCFIAPRLSDKLGRKKSLAITALLFTVSVIGTAIAHNFTVFVLFRIIGGLAIGLASVISPIYLAELSPSKFRGRTTALYAVCCVGGQSVVLLTNYFITKSTLPEVMINMGWRYILATALVPCALFIFFIAFIPESPRWNVLKGKYDEALDTLTKISNREHAESVFNEIKHSFSDKTAHQHKSRLRLDKTTIPLLIIGIGLAVGNQISGINVIQYFGPTLLKNVAGSTDSALLQTFWLSICQFIGVLAGMMVIDKIGRRKLLLLGAITSCICLAYSFIAFYYHLPGMLAVVGLFAYMIFFGMTWGQIVWTVLGEIFPTEIRSICVGISICAMSLANFVISSTFPIMNSSPMLLDLFHGGFPLLLFAIFSLGMYFFTFRYLPETAGVSLEKIHGLVLEKFNVEADLPQSTSTTKSSESFDIPRH